MTIIQAESQHAIISTNKCVIHPNNNTIYVYTFYLPMRTKDTHPSLLLPVPARLKSSVCVDVSWHIEKDHRGGGILFTYLNNLYTYIHIYFFELFSIEFDRCICSILPFNKTINVNSIKLVTKL